MTLFRFVGCLGTFLLFVLAGCSGSGSLKDNSPEIGGAPAPGGHHRLVAPDRCRLVCTVLEVLFEPVSSGPCSKAPCAALVRIDTVLAYGFSFPPVLNSGQSIRARFVFTTERSDLWFPALKARYPGVTAGTRLQADAELSGSPDEGDRARRLVIDDYTIR